LYEAATGRPAFQRPSVAATLGAILHATPEPPRAINPQLPESLAGVIERLIEKDPKNRMATAADVRDALIGSTSTGAGPLSELRSVSPSLPTLGVKRSTAHVWTFMAGGSLATVWLFAALASRFDPDFLWIWGRGAPIGFAALGLLAMTPVAWWIGKRRAQKELPLTGTSLVRLRDPGESSTKWAVLQGLMIFLAVTLTAGVALMAWRSWQDGFSAKRTFSLVIDGLLAAYFWTVVLSSRGWRRRPRSFCHKDADLEVEGSYAQILARCSRAIARVGARVTELDLDRGIVRANTPRGLLAAGEKISFVIQGLQEGRYSIRLESDSLNPLQLWDYGKNTANLRASIQALVQ
jgi:hypothetical protein